MDLAILGYASGKPSTMTEDGKVFSEASVGEVRRVVVDGHNSIILFMLNALTLSSCLSNSCFSV